MSLASKPAVSTFHSWFVLLGVALAFHHFFYLFNGLSILTMNKRKRNRSGSNQYKKTQRDNNKTQNTKITSKLLSQGYRNHKLRKTFGNFSDHTLNFYQNLVLYRFKEYVTKGISHLVFYGDLVYKLRRVRGSINLIVSGTNTVRRRMTQRLRKRQYALT